MQIVTTRRPLVDAGIVVSGGGSEVLDGDAVLFQKRPARPHFADGQKFFVVPVEACLAVIE